MWSFQTDGKSRDSRKKTDTSDLLLFQESLQERIQLFEKEKEMETGLMEEVKNLHAVKHAQLPSEPLRCLSLWQVLEEMQKERSALLLSQTDGLAVQIATIHYQKAERCSKLLETSRAALALQSLLIQQLRERKQLEKQELAQVIQSHCQVETAV